VQVFADEPASPSRAGGLVRVRLDLAYDGTAFSGWATQPGQRTVQETVEDALIVVLRLKERAGLTVAGRTDAGVHARGQVAHVDLPGGAWSALDEPLRALAGVLPADVRVTAAVRAPDGFDARFSALSRRYAYRVCDDAAGPDPLRRHEVLWHRRRLDVSAMADAARVLVGLHDFAAFCRRRSGATTVRTLLALDVTREASSLVRADVEADAFCHSMVRALLGALLPVGEGRRSTGWPGEVLRGGVRNSAVNVVPAHGLTLEAVHYPPAEELADRAQATRRPRA